ncbi:MAG: thioredoxin family protein, partial [Bacteroidota bacterium]
VHYFKGSWQQLKESANNQKKPYVVSFYADWCEPCQRMNNTTLAEEEVVRLLNQHYLYLNVNGETLNGVNLADQMEVTHYPTFYFFDAMGQLLRKVEGYQRIDTFLGFLEENTTTNTAVKGISFLEGSWEDVSHKAKKAEKPFFIDFYADWCGPCKSMDKGTFKNPYVGKYVDEHFIALQVNAEEGEGVALADEYKVKSYPTIAFFNEKGKLIGKEIGYRDAQDFLKILKKYDKIVSAEKVGIDFFQGSWKALLAEAKKEGKPFFVDFYTDWCGPCKLMTKKTFSDASIGMFANQNFIAYKINAEEGEGLTLANKYNIRGYPSVFFFDAKGELIGRELGYQDKDRFMYTMEKYLEKAEKKK